jgi:hypothetical protein
VDFTREPIIETVITPKEGCKLVVRSSKSTGQEEYFVDAVEMVAFGSSLFFRSQERPKAFLVPVTDYEILEVREARMILKNVGLDRSIKIAGGREGNKASKESSNDKAEAVPLTEKEAPPASVEGAVAEVLAEGRVDKKRDRRRQYKRRRGRDEEVVKEGESGENTENGSAGVTLPPSTRVEGEEEKAVVVPMVTSSSVISSLLPPPTMLISETIARYKDNALFKGAFFIKDEDKQEGSPTSDHHGNTSNDLVQSDVSSEVNDDSEKESDVEELHRLRNEVAPYEKEGYLQGTLSYEEEVSDAEAEGMPAGPLPEVNAAPAAEDFSETEENP